ncbi:hypothetical protein ARMGADRAFT_1079819 [Armillaria gallica]|uniref:Uncharacterized protein n=1 Tax=Armillaria gallica TaxID=47427 RepID=A0A2H3DWN8_ARMGA|nr:hypothetical protein ARMGADRAFT_1079819 [Armillaria gallica]
MITQEMLDNAYPWAQAWIDQHLTIHFQAHYRDLEVVRHECIRRYGEPQLTAKFQEWWSPSMEDTHRIRALLYYERYKHQPSGKISAQSNPYMLLRGKSSIFTWLNEFPPTIPSQASVSMNAMPDTSALTEVDMDMPMLLTADTTMETTLNGVVDDASMDNNDESNVNTSELIDELSKTHITPRAQSE